MGEQQQLVEQAGPEQLRRDRGTTDSDGRARDLLTSAPEPGRYRLTFDTGSYLDGGFYPEVSVTFVVEPGEEHYHVPLLLSPFGYSTYRGS